MAPRFYFRTLLSILSLSPLRLVPLNSWIYRPECHRRVGFCMAFFRVKFRHILYWAFWREDTRTIYRWKHSNPLSLGIYLYVSRARFGMTNRRDLIILSTFIGIKPCRNAKKTSVWLSKFYVFHTVSGIKDVRLNAKKSMMPSGRFTTFIYALPTNQASNHIANQPKIFFLGGLKHRFTCLS